MREREHKQKKMNENSKNMQIWYDCAQALRNVFIFYISKQNGSFAMLKRHLFKVEHTERWPFALQKRMRHND